MKQFVKLTTLGIIGDEADWILVQSPYLTTFCNYDLAKKIRDYSDYIEMFSTWYGKWIQLPKNNLVLSSVTITDTKTDLEFKYCSDLLKEPINQVLTMLNSGPVLFSHLKNTMALSIGKFDLIMNDGTFIVDVNKRYIAAHRIAPINL